MTISEQILSRGLIKDSGIILPEIKQIIKLRRSCRCFNPSRDLPIDIVRRLIKEAFNLSSAICNPAQFDVRIFQDTEVRRSLTKVKKGHQPQPEQVSIVLVLSVKNEYIHRQKKALIIAGIITEALLLVATSLGIDSLWISSFDEEKVNFSFR